MTYQNTRWGLEMKHSRTSIVEKILSRLTEVSYLGIMCIVQQKGHKTAYVAPDYLGHPGTNHTPAMKCPKIAKEICY